MKLTLSKWLSVCQKWRWLFFICLISFVLIPKVSDAEKKVERKFYSKKKAAWRDPDLSFRTHKWISSAECFRKTGVLLAFFEEDLWESFRGSGVYERKSELIDFSLGMPADDPGHTVLLSLSAKLLDRKMGPLDAGKLNVYINALGLIAILTLIFAMRLYFLAGIVLLFSKLVFFNTFGVDPHAGFIGTSALALVLPLVIVGYHMRSFGNKTAIGFGLSGVLFLALAALIRGAIGMMGLSVTLCVVTLLLWKHRKSLKRAAIPLVLGALALIGAASPQWIYMIRDALSPIEVSKFNEKQLTIDKGHGFSHTLYVSLGFESNPWGIEEWNDSCGQKAVAKVSPEITYLTPQYFKAIREIYMNIVRESPKEVVEIYWKKFKRICHIPIIGDRLMLSLLAFLILLFLRRG
ncbi:MAG: hypothetical protein K1060chlam2_00696, partial [Chlamydiae bacterium]|nr:hypothetical protein [Chlamydiota bacterium]